MDLPLASVSETKLHIGCGTKILPGWINIDRTARAPGVVTDIDPTALPFARGSVAAILAEHVLEHLTFAEERAVWQELARVLRAGGQLVIEVPDFAWVCKTFLEATDDWRDFYIVGHRDHYAGCGRALDQRWGILQTMFFGNQNGPGQFHHSSYTEGKIRALARALGFSAVAVEKPFNKGGQCLRAVLTR
ncbi:MAG TPA: methyltransferase domain-containing protein [Acetobacteraceae bacterium]|nr:methyltransferase domain-containing protein [Acetobacteraceae bacterium]